MSSFFYIYAGKTTLDLQVPLCSGLLLANNFVCNVLPELQLKIDCLHRKYSLKFCQISNVFSN